MLKRLAKTALLWTAANPARAAELAIALAILGATLASTGRLDRRLLKRVFLAFF